MEMATFIAELPGHQARPFTSVVDPTGCPFEQDNLCSVHPIRPFGCRIFFCDEAVGDWQRQQYERFHAELKRLHDRFDVPYFYVEWRQALKSVYLPVVSEP